MKRIFAALIVMFSVVCWADTFEEGVSAYSNNDYATALLKFIEAASEGHAGAQYSLGWMYNNGMGVQKNNTEAIKWYRLSAEKGVSFAQVMLGMIYESGDGVAQNHEESIKWYKLAAAQGIDIAQRNLGLKLQKGEGVTQNYTEAVKWYRLAAEQGHGAAQVNLGLMYEDGNGVIQDFVKAHMWYNLASSLQANNAQLFRENIVKKMTKNQIEKAQELARDCEARNYKQCN